VPFALTVVRTCVAGRRSPELLCSAAADGPLLRMGGP
jgi:hypothetical protein